MRADVGEVYEGHVAVFVCGCGYGVVVLVLVLVPVGARFRGSFLDE